MGGPDRDADRAEEKRKNKERYDNFILAAHGRCADGHVSPAEAGKLIDAFGLLPKGGKW